MAGVIRTSEGNENYSDSTSMSGFMGESTSETEGAAQASGRERGRRTGAMSTPSAVSGKLAPGFRDRRSPSVNDGLGKGAISEGIPRVTGK